MASASDAASIVSFFSQVYDAHHGPAAAGALHLEDRTRDVLFPQQDPPDVLVFEAADGAIEGVTAVRIAPESRAAELLTVQVFDTVQGKGIGQTLLRSTVDHVRAAGATLVYTDVDREDVRARGFLRREGFVVEVADDESTGAEDAGTVRYVLVLPA